MDLDTPMMLYCERLTPGLLAEPLNAASNLAFIVAAACAWKSAADRPVAMRAQRLLATLLALVGFASLGFHTLATQWAGILDVAFIGIFNLCYLVLFLRVVQRWSARAVTLAALAFLGLDRLTAAALPAGALHGSGLYLPPVFVLGLLVLAARRRAPAESRMMAQAAGVFVLSLTARTLDQPLCPVWPWGTHFVWHLLNAWVLYRLIQALRAGA